MNGGVDFARLKKGDKLHLYDGSSAEVLNVLENGRIAYVRYDGGREDFVSAPETAAVTPAPPGPEWAGRVSVVLHHVPESEESEEGYEAVTMGGVPLGAIVTYSDAETAQEALDGLLGTLAAFGYRGTVAVQDVTQSGRSDSYEVEIGGGG